MKKILSALLATLLLLGILVACSETESPEPVSLAGALEHEAVPVQKQEPELSRLVVTLTIKERVLSCRPFAEIDDPPIEDAVTTAQIRRRGDTIVLATWNYEWGVITIEDIWDNYVVVYLDAYARNGIRNAETVKIAYGEELVIVTPTYGGAVEWTLVFDDRMNLLDIPPLWRSLYRIEQVHRW